ncbi:MAG: aromatic amino acid lyase [Gammaproteobacteria bacterium]|nr:aromatic amino acid lyase [Gammaproteobacteria bacterium]MDE2345856.1 aromatic amino acid lyase [Gammaproteobacteria bacterium]
MAKDGPEKHITIGGRNLTLIEVGGISRGAPFKLNASTDFRKRIQRGAASLTQLIAAGRPVYGVTTGYGDSCTVSIPGNVLEHLPEHLVRYHGCGLGAYFDEPTTIAIMATRLNCLALGYSGVRMELLEQLEALIQQRVIPLVPEEGSVGASGDLTPLSYVAAAMIGEREVQYQGRVMSARAALQAIAREPITLKPKEGLAMMNGTSVMTALACLAWERAEYLVRLASRITAMSCLALGGNPEHFEAGLFAAKPHRGPQQVAAWIAADMRASGHEDLNRIQDRYSIRCAPHVIGVLSDALEWMQRDIENELNSANDNPIIDPDTGRLYHGGHFYGGHMAFVADSMKTAVANIADLLDRQLALLVDPRFNNGLPSNLSAATGDRASLNHGFKAVQIAVSAWTAEALKLTMPASVFSRSTECHNQDKVSMGTISARDAVRVLDLVEQVAAACLAAASQALEIRRRQHELPAAATTGEVAIMRNDVLGICACVEEDRPLEQDLRHLCAALRQRRWKLYT